MGIRKSKESSLSKVRSSLAVTKTGLKKVSPKADLKGYPGSGKDHSVGNVDPSDFMDAKQKRAWRRLTSARRRLYIIRAGREAGKKTSIKGVAVRKPVPREAAWQDLVDPETAKRLAKARLEGTGTGRDTEAGKKNTGRKRNVRDTKNPGQNIKEGDPRSSSEGREATGQELKGSSTSASISGGSREGRVKSAGNKTQVIRRSSPFPVEGSRVSPKGIAVSTAKKAADRFNRDLAARLSISREKKETSGRDPYDGRSFPPSVEKTIGTAAGMAGGMVFHTAAKIVSGAVAAGLSLLLVPAAILITAVSFGLALFTGIGGAVDEMESYYTGGGQDLVDVAIREIGYREEQDGSTKYGTWAGIGAASWCHAFVSWCANECGYIEDGTIPKTASCENGRQWFIRRDEYRERGAYEPQPGDIVYFRHGSEKVSHHVGIVEFVESGILHTIEGNSGGVVRRRKYPLSADRIMGYGTPSYPDLGIDAYGSAADFLQTVRKLGETIISDGNWVYSNHGTQKNLDDARRSGQPKTNCAMATSIAMQEFGTLKKSQFFYAGSGGSLCGNSAVKKRVRQYYDIVRIGGKKNGAGAKLKPGDVCLWDNHVNVYAGEDHGKKVWYDFGRKSVSDRTSNSGHFVRFIHKGNPGNTLYYVLRLKDQDSYGKGKQIRIPAGLGDTYTYMGWSIIRTLPTRQYYLRERSGEHYDRNGFAVVDGRYVIACTTTFGKVGDYIDFVLDNGKVIHAVMGDEKNQSDPGCTRWGHI